MKPMLKADSWWKNKNGFQYYFDKGKSKSSSSEGSGFYVSVTDEDENEDDTTNTKVPKRIEEIRSKIRLLQNATNEEAESDGHGYALMHLMQKFADFVYARGSNNYRNPNRAVVLQPWLRPVQQTITMFALVIAASTVSKKRRALIRSFMYLCNTYVDFNLAAYKGISDRKSTYPVATRIYKFVTQVVSNLANTSNEGVIRVIDIFLSSKIIRNCEDEGTLKDSIFKVIISDPEPYKPNAESFLKYMALMYIYKEHCSHTEKIIKLALYKINDLPYIPTDGQFVRDCFRKELPSDPQQLTATWISEQLKPQKLVGSAQSKGKKVVISIKNKKLIRVKEYLSSLEKKCLAGNASHGQSIEIGESNDLKDEPPSPPSVIDKHPKTKRDDYLLAFDDCTVIPLDQFSSFDDSGAETDSFEFEPPFKPPKQRPVIVVNLTRVDDDEKLAAFCSPANKLQFGSPNKNSISQQPITVEEIKILEPESVSENENSEITKVPLKSTFRRPAKFPEGAPALRTRSRSSSSGVTPVMTPKISERIVRRRAVSTPKPSPARSATNSKRSTAQRANATDGGNKRATSAEPQSQLPMVTPRSVSTRNKRAPAPIPERASPIRKKLRSNSKPTA